MIEVKYYREENKLVIDGHAKSDEYGRDLICAACSTLAVTMSANVAYIAASGCVTDPVTSMGNGHAEISCKPKVPFRDVVRQIYMSVCIGFEMLATEYPDYISYTVL